MVWMFKWDEFIFDLKKNSYLFQWECTSEMPQKFKFGKISVSCEGYNYPEDPYILAGSCGVSESIWNLQRK